MKVSRTISLELSEWQIFENEAKMKDWPLSKVIRYFLLIGYGQQSERAEEEKKAIDSILQDMVNGSYDVK